MGDRTTLSVQRWSKYGKSRLYVNTDDGRRVGWVDLDTGVRTVEQAELAEEFAAAVAPHLGHSPRVPVEAMLPAPVSPPQVAVQSRPAETEGWEDLALRRPGQGVREEAQAQLAAMRGRSRVGAFVNRALDVKTEERAFRVGADGEETVGARLERLVDRGWHVLHSVPVGTRGSDIDHVLIGPGGVYTVNTKNHPGKSIWVGKHAIKVDGFSQPYLRNSRFEADRAARLLATHFGAAVPVRAVLVILTGTLVPNITYKQQPDDVSVLDRMDIPRVFKRAPERLTPAEVQRLYDIARRSTAWIG